MFLKTDCMFSVQDNEVTSTTPPEPVSADAEDPISGVADLTNLLAYIETGYSKRSYPLIKPGRWLAQVCL
ncbi:hypothetical protein EB796_007120 [Bugula neritina]|uniref:Uncharacterized protein n=1 Tax=Bugula neritina TaxID=10212 RepID=A0A7J7K7G1_BUGNE|nr:hypothetical protein EB796_007120 [Bugula neritina]